MPPYIPNSTLPLIPADSGRVQLQDPSFQGFSGSEPDAGSGRYGNSFFRMLWVAADSGFAGNHVKHAEVAQLDSASGGDFIRMSIV